MAKTKKKSVSEHSETVLTKASETSAKRPICVRMREKFADPAFRKRFSRAGAAAVLWAALSVIGFFGYARYAELYSVPVVSGANFSFEYRKIPFDVASVDFTLSTEIDPSTVNASTVSVSPTLSGYPSVKNGNIVTFALSEKMTVGSKYVFTLSKDIASKRGKRLWHDYVVELEAVAWVKVAKAIPTWETDQLSKNPIFIFNIPVVALGSLSEKDKIPCPVKIEPEAPGRCSWIAGNVLEYVLDKPLSGSTKYSVAVENSEGFLYPMKETFRTEFRTPVLAALVDTGSSVPTFSPKDGMVVRFNTEVDVSELEKKLELFEDLTSNKISPKVVALGGGAVSNAFSITGKDGPLDHSFTYRAKVSAGLLPAYGNVPMAKAVEWKARSNDFISNVSVKYASYSETWALLDTPEVYSYGWLLPIIPARQGILSMDFDEDVKFDKDAAKILGENGSVLSECDLSSFERDGYDESGKEKKFTSFKCVVKSPLPYWAKAVLSVSKSVSKSLKADAQRGFVVSPEFKVSDFKLLSATEACLYSTTPLRSEGDVIATVPASKTREIVRDGRWEWKNGENKEVFTCPKIEGKTAFVVSVRLNPKTEYSFKLKKGTVDSYGNSLAADVEFGKQVSSDITEKDKYLYSSASKEINVIPSEAKIVLGLKSVNIASAVVEVCETDAFEYFKFSANSWKQNYSPKCKNVTKVSVPLQNRHWELSPKQIDVEGEILKREAESPFVIVRGSAYDKFNVAEGGYRDSVREFANFYVRSNLSLTFEQGADRGYLFAASYDGTDIPSNLSFDAYSYDYPSESPVPEKAKFTWNAKRQAYEVSKTARPISFVVAKNANYYGVLSLPTDSVSNYDFWYVSWQDTSNRDYAYVYGDRPIYRSGDTAFFKGILRRFQPEWYAPSPIKDLKVRVVDQEWQLFKELPVKTDKNSNFSGSFELPKGMKTGRYDFEILNVAKTGEETVYVYNDGHFYVEQYVKPVFKVTASESAYHALPEEKVSVPFSAEYYFWGAVAGAKYTARVMSQNYFFDPKDYSAYRFWTASSWYDCVYWGYCDHSDSFVTELNGSLDGNGRAILSYTMPKLAPEDREELYTFNIETVDNDTGKTVTQTVTKALHKTDANVGIRSPYWVNKGEPIKADGVILDHSAKPLSGKSAKIEFVRREWKEVKKLGIDGTYYSENEIVEAVEKTVSATSDSEGKFRAEYLPAKGGEFEIRATYVGKNGNAAISSEYAYSATEEYVSWGGSNNSITELTAEKTVLKPGEKAVFTLKSPVKSGKAFITVEKDDAVLDAFVRNVTSYAEKIEIPLETRHIPNAYVKAFVIGKPEGSPLPIYKRALSVVKVLPDEKRLSVTVTADRDRKSPGEPLTVAVFVKDALGNPVSGANGSLSVVDESVLALLGNPKKNPFAFFYEMKRYLGVQTALSLTNLVEKLEVKSASNADGAKGWAGEDRKGGDAKKKRGVFKDTAFWRSDFVTDKNGKFSVTTDNLPDNLTTWVIEALVSTSSDTKIGIWQTTVTTSKEIMVNDNLPRLFRSGDRTVLSPVVFNRTGTDADFEVSLSAEGMDVQKPVQKVRIANGESKTVSFPVTVNDVPSGAASSVLKVAIAAKSGSKTDAVEKTVPAYRSETWETVATVGSAKDASFDERLNLGGIDSSRAELSIRYSASLFGNATNGLEHLLSYPYGCVEQKTSAIVPHVVSKRLADALGSPFDIDKVTVPYFDSTGKKTRTVREALSDYASSAKTFAKGDGGFWYWPEAPRSDFAMTSYAVKTLAQVRNMGVAVEPSVLANASAYLKHEFYANKRPNCSVPNAPASFADTCAYSTKDRLSAISAVLAVKSDDYEAYKMWKLVNQESLGSVEKTTALSLLASMKKMQGIVPADLDSIGKSVETLSESVLKTALVYDSRGAYVAASDEDGGRIRASAEFVEAMVRLGKDSNETAQILDNVSRFLAKSKRADGSYGSTLDTVAVLSAFATRAASDAASVTNFVAKASVNGQNVAETGISKSDVTKSFEKRVPLAGLPKDSTVNFSKTGNGKLYYDLSLTYPVPARDIAARDEGMFVKTEYYDENEYRRIEALKNEEERSYSAGKIRYDELKYPKSVYEYLDTVDSFKVGQLVRVRYRVIVAEIRDRVAFESFAPAGAELVNTRLATESKTVRKDTFFDREEFLDDRYFAYAETLEAGDYEGSYAFRATHVGSYSVPPTKIFEFYNPEVFGRTQGRISDVFSK